MSEQNEEELEAKMEEFLRQQAERESGAPSPFSVPGTLSSPSVGAGKASQLSLSLI